MERKTITYRVLGSHKVDSLISHRIAMNELKKEVESAYLDLNVSMGERSIRYNKIKRRKEKKFSALYEKARVLLENLESLQAQKTKLAQIPNISGSAMDLAIIDIEKGIIKAEIDKDIEKLSEEYYRVIEKMRAYLNNNARPSLDLVKGKIDPSLRKSIDEDRNKASKKMHKMAIYLHEFGEIRPLSNWTSYEASKMFSKRVADISDKRSEVNESIHIQEKELESFIRDVHDLNYRMAVTDKSLIPSNMNKEYKTIKRTVTPRTISALKSTLDRLKNSNKTQIDLEAAKDALSKNVVFFTDKRLKKLERMIDDLSTKVDKAYQKHSKENFEILSEKLHKFHNVSNLASAARSFEMDLRNNERIAEEQKDISRGTHVVQGNSTYQEIKISELQTRANELRAKGDTDSETYRSIMRQISEARNTIDRNKALIESKEQEKIKTTIPSMYTDLDKKYTDETSGGMKL